MGIVQYFRVKEGRSMEIR